MYLTHKGYPFSDLHDEQFWIEGAIQYTVNKISLSQSKLDQLGTTLVGPLGRTVQKW
jgi:hypothetical protein